MTKTIMWVTGLLLMNTSAHALTICQSGKTEGGTGHWYWREIDNRKCWYQGTKYLPKSELVWSKTEPRTRMPTHQHHGLPDPVLPVPEAPTIIAPEPEEEQTKVDQIMADTRLNADQLLAFTCCWPELEEEPVYVSMPTPKVDTSRPLFIWSLMPIGFIIGLYTIYRYAKENMS
jgi:hypothetical protein